MHLRPIFLILLLFLGFFSLKQLLNKYELSSSLGAGFLGDSPKLDPHINMSGNGTFKIYLPGDQNGNHILSASSQWMQDDLNKKLYISAGDALLGDPICLNKFWFVEGKHYIMSFESDNCSKPVCTCVTGYGYNEEIDHYNSTYLGYLGRQFNPKLQKNVDVYAGRTLDGVGPLSLLMYVGVDSKAYMGLTILESKKITGLEPNVPYFNEYLYNDVSLTFPDEKYNRVPQLCLEIERENGCSEYPYDNFGNLK